MVRLKFWLLAGLIFGLATSPGVAAPPPGIPDGWSDGYVYVNGIRIHYYHAVPQPGKPVMVMAHGFSDNGLSWTTLTEDLQKSYDIYMPDARSHGLSDPFTDSADGDTLIKDLVGFVRAMHFDKPILMGHSMGAATVIRAAAEYPTLPRAAIMLDPLLAFSPARGPASPNRPETTPPLGRTSPPKPASSSMFGTPEQNVANNNKPYEQLVAACRLQNPKWNLVDCQYWALSKQQFHGFYSPAQIQAVTGTMVLGDALARITVPVLILKADAPADVRTANLKAAGALQNGKLIHVDGAAHNLHHDQRSRTVQLVNEFLSSFTRNGQK